MVAQPRVRGKAFRGALTPKKEKPQQKGAMKIYKGRQISGEYNPWAL